MRLCLLICLGLGLGCSACGKQNSNVFDVGPRFEVDSMAGEADTTHPMVIRLKRNDPQSGPLVQLQPMSTSGILSSKRSLVCPPLAPFKSKAATAPDVKVFSFKISDEEFPGMSELPLESSCTLEIVMTNQYHSTFTKRVPVLIHFDNQPPAEIRRTFLAEGALPKSEMNGLAFILEKYSITNQSRLSLRFVLKPSSQWKFRVKYDRETMAGVIKMPIHSTEYARAEIQVDEFTFLPDRDLRILPQVRSGEYRFEVPPGKRAQVEVVGSVPALLAQSVTLSPSGNAPWPAVRTFDGIYVTLSRQNIEAPGLFTSRSFEWSEEDETKPLAASLVSQGPLKTLPKDAALLNKLVGD